ncbi:hypothetical protein D3C86_2131180 [compost metagenome]
MHILVIEHGQQLLAIQLLLLRLHDFSGAYHRRLRYRHLNDHQHVRCRKQYGQSAGKCTLEHEATPSLDQL